VRTGFAVIGDTQHLPGYSLLLTEDPAVKQLTDLPWARRREFLFELSLLGEAVAATCADSGLRRINYEILGNSIDWLHGHVHARYERQPPTYVRGPVWLYPAEERNARECAYDDEKHGPLRAQITRHLREVIQRADY
jgi:diadenosine tetraphosphate (Ap4A) HIT family hydrolase